MSDVGFREKGRKVFAQRRRRDKGWRRHVSSWFAFDSLFPLCVKKKRKVVARRRRRDKGGRRHVSSWFAFDSLFPLCVKKKEKFSPEEDEGTKGEKACFLLVCLRFFVSFVCEKKEERFSREEDEGTKGGEGMLPVGLPSILCFLFMQKRKKSFRPKKTKGQRVEKGCFLSVCLRPFISFVCEKKVFARRRRRDKGWRRDASSWFAFDSLFPFYAKKEEKFSSEEDEGRIKIAEGMFLLLCLCFLLI
jgi:hypothetical protein